MGRQIHFYMLDEDCRQFFEVIQRRFDVTVTERDSDGPQIEAIDEPCSVSRTVAIWNRGLVATLERKFIPESNRGPYYRIDNPETLEFMPCHRCDWQGRPALTQGRVYGGFGKENQEARAWFEAISRWIRKNYAKNQLLTGGYIGATALAWHQSGGVLLPLFQPPPTSAWLEFARGQHPGS